MAEQILTVFNQRSHRDDARLNGGGVEPVRSQRGNPDRDGMSFIDFAAMRGRQQPHPSGQFGRNADDLDPVGAQLPGLWCAEPGRHSDSPRRVDPLLGEPTLLAVTVSVDLNQDDLKGLECGVDDGGSSGCLAWGDSDDDTADRR